MEFQYMSWLLNLNDSHYVTQFIFFQLESGWDHKKFKLVKKQNFCSLKKQADWEYYIYLNGNSV